MNGKIFHDWIQDFSSLMETFGTEWFWIQVIPGLRMGNQCAFREVPDEWEATIGNPHIWVDRGPA